MGYKLFSPNTSNYLLITGWVQLASKLPAAHTVSLLTDKNDNKNTRIQVILGHLKVKIDGTNTKR